MSRQKVEERVIGCPVVENEAACPRCGGGWPGTRSRSADLVKAAKRGRLVPENLGCCPLREQGRFLLDAEKRKAE